MKLFKTLSTFLVIFGTAILIINGCDKPDPTGPASTARLILVPENYEAPADGMTTTNVVAYVRNPDGTAADGAPIFFSASCGLIREGEAAVAGGTATMTIESSTYPCTSAITASLPTMSLENTTHIEFTSITSETLILHASPTSILADGVAQSTITAKVYGEDGNPVIDGTTVYFSTDMGTLSAESAETSLGKAHVMLTSSEIPGTATVTAVSGVVSDSVQVRFSSTDVKYIELTASPYTIGTGQQSIVTATVYDQNNRKKAGVTVYFTTNLGSIDSSATTDQYGTATVKFSSSTAGSALITAVAGDVSAYIVIEVEGGTIPSPTPGDGPIEITPGAAILTVGESETFQATGGSGSYYWYLDDAGAARSIGTLSADYGKSTIFTAENEGEGDLYAVDTNNYDNYGSAFISVTE